MSVTTKNTKIHFLKVYNHTYEQLWERTVKDPTLAALRCYRITERQPGPDWWGKPQPAEVGFELDSLRDWSHTFEVLRSAGGFLTPATTAQQEAQ